MQANKRNLSEILSSDIRLVAPLFQRPYVWKREENWEPLWHALLEVFERRKAAETPRPYFMGALVLDQLPSPIGSVPSREIIDGQQRMTTLQILLERARAAFEEIGLEHPAKLLEKLTRNDLEDESDEQFKVWPTNVDRDTFRAVMTRHPASGLLEDAARFFDECLRTWLCGDDVDTKERAALFVSAVKQDLVFVAIDLDNDDDGQLIFETLNSLGTPLLPSDLVKNLLFRAAIDEKLDTQALYLKYWKQFEDDQAYWRGKTNVGRRERVLLDLFLQYYLTYKLGKEPELAHQFRNYRDAFRDGKFGATEAALADFAFHARLFREFDERKGSEAAIDLRNVLEVLDTSVPNPLAVGIFANVPEGTERDNMLRAVESYLVRRFLCGVTTKNYNRIIADLIAALKRNGWNSENLKFFLSSLSGSTVEWPSDSSVQWKLTQGKAYGNLRSNGLGYVLGRVEAKLRTSMSEGSWNTRTPLTIEHLMPRQWREHWPLANAEDTVATARRDELVHHIGNLTVLTRGLNASASNAPWDQKRTKLNEHSVLRINSQLSAKPVWTEDSIEERSQELASKFCELWPV